MSRFRPKLWYPPTGRRLWRPGRGAPSRRAMLRGAGGALLGLPFLDALAPRTAWAGTRTPKRLLVVVHRQGTVMNRWLPSGSELDWTLNDILVPLADHQDRISVIAGLDNMVPAYNTTGDGHTNAELSLLTGQPFLDQGADTLTPAGSSIEQVIAERIGIGTPFQRFDVSVGGSSTGYQTADHFWVGPGDPVTATSNPLLTYARLFGDTDLTPEEAKAQAARRGSVLDAVLEDFTRLEAQLSGADRERLDAHAEKIRAIEQRVTSAGAQSCTAPEMDFPSDYDFSLDDDVSFSAQAELLTLAFACDQARVGTLHFATGENPTFPWLDINGAPLVDTSVYDNWHTMVHSGREEEGLVVGFTWYTSCFAQLLDMLAATTDSDGDNLLDTTTVVLVSEFGNGIGHNTYKIPVVIAGNLGDAGTGRFLDYMNGGPDDDYTASAYSTTQLWVSLLQLFGGTDTTFGYTDGDIPQGTLPGLLS